MRIQHIACAPQLPHRSGPTLWSPFACPWSLQVLHASVLKGLLTPRMGSAHTVCGCLGENNNRASCTLYCRPPSDPKGWDRWLLPAYMLFTLICQQNKEEMTSTLYYVGKSLNYELSLFFQKANSRHCEKDILCGGQAMPLISKAVASQEINGL